MANQKLTREELEKLQEVQQNTSALIQELGSIQLAQLNLDERQEKAEEFRNELKTKESSFAKELQDKYGVGSINIEKGEFIPSEDQPAEQPAESPAAETVTKTVE
jgi:hypothetical protein